MALLAQMMQKRLFLIIITVILICLEAVVTLLWNSQLSTIINIISLGNLLTMYIIVWVLITMLIWTSTAYISSYISGLTCEYLIHDLRMGYARYFSSLPISEIESLNAGKQLSKLQNEIADVSGYLNGNLIQLFSDSIRFITTFSWLLILNMKLALTINLPVLIILIYVFYSSKIISRATERSQQSKGRMNKHADTLLTLFPIIRLYDATHLMLRSYNKEIVEWEHQTVQAERIRARLMSLSGLLSNILLMLLFFVGGGMIINGVLTIGTLYIFLNLSGNISGVMMNMPGYISAFRQFLVNMKRLSPKILLNEREQ